MPSNFAFGPVSLHNLENVKPELVTLAHKALSLSTQDFCITCGLRTPQAQLIAVAQGHSKTEHSKHLIQPDGLSHAIDAVPWVDGKPSWDWEHIYAVAAAFHQAAKELGIAENIRWGGVWDRTMFDLGESPDDFHAAVDAYAARHAGPDLLDGPHYEWVESKPDGSEATPEAV
jgi:peptidoglycan L-alanyl-D-glutamate endopeptidase CwlK